MNALTSSSRRFTAALDRRALIALAMGLLVLFAIVGSSVWQAARNARALTQVSATVEVGSLLRNILLAVEDCETGQRGYLLTNREIYLTPFIRGKAALPGLLDELDQRLPNQPAVAELRKTIEAKVAELSHTRDLIQAGNSDAALAVILTDEGRTEMGRIRQLSAGLTANQQGELARQSASIRVAGQWLIAIDSAGLVLVVGIIVIIGFGLHRYLAVLADARADAANAYDVLARSNERLDETVHTRTAELTLANDEIQRFAYIVSHDLRSPLVNIMGFTNELEQATHTLTQFAEAALWPEPVREAATEDIPEALRFIKASTSKMDRLINAILKLSREGRRSLAHERLDLGPLFQEIVAAMGHQAKDVEIEIGPMPALWSDRMAVEQVFGNVVDNALKYLKRGRPGRIAITARQDGATWQIAIADNGRGIAARDFERVFELFRRAGDQSVPGEGIGLAHVRALVRRLGGRIDCASTLDVGTTFTVTLPEHARVNAENAL